MPNAAVVKRIDVCDNVRMAPVDYHSLIEHYEACLDRHGDTPQGVDWPNAADAETRYRVMLDLVGNTHGEPVTLLDFGCGAAHLADYLARHNRRDISYMGLDASPKFVELARTKHPQLPLYCLDVLATGTPAPEADFVVMNGVFTEKRGMSFDEMRGYMEQLLQHVFKTTRVGLAFNVMSKHVDWERDDLFHLPFDTLVSFLRSNLSRHIVLRADYGLYEYTTYVYREPR